MWGRKRFYLIPPTVANMRAYEKWTSDPRQDSVFLGDLVEPGNIYRVDLEAGQTLLLPGGWIHSVYTPQDSLVFGGNFLLSMCIYRQLQVFEMERRTNVGKAFRFPYFVQTVWYALSGLLAGARFLAGSHSKKSMMVQQVLTNCALNFTSFLSCFLFTETSS